MSEQKSIQREKKEDSRVRNWNILVYPDSAPDNWREILDDKHIQWAESPLHDKDVNADGTPKKPHWHITLVFKGNKSYSQILSITNELHTTIPQICDSVTGSVRYMAHLDNPEKYQYSPALIVGHGGIDLGELLKPTTSQRYQRIKAMIKFISEEGIYEFCDFFEYCAEERFDDWFPLLCDNSAYIVKEYITSRRGKEADDRKKYLERE